MLSVARHAARRRRSGGWVRDVVRYATAATAATPQRAERIHCAVREHLDSVVKRHDELVRRLGDGTAASSLSQDELTAASKEIADLSKLVLAKTRMDDLEGEMRDLRQMMAEEEEGGEGDGEGGDADGTDASPAGPAAAERLELGKLAAEEHGALSTQLAELIDTVVDDMLPKDDLDAKGCVVEVRAGTGGEEACLFARDLYNMYQRFSAHRGWVWEVVERSASGMGDGYKVAIATVTARGGERGRVEDTEMNPYGVLKYESGVHRVQRVPATESQGRIHTSAASVTILPEADALDIDIRDEDIRIDTFRASGAGGQHVNTTDSAVRVTHVPTGTVVSIQDERSQHKNKAKALAVLRARIYDAEQQRIRSEQSETRKRQIGSGDRSARVRTYNEPQSRVTDHRVAHSVHGDLTRGFLLDAEVLGGLIDELRLKERERGVEELFGGGRGAGAGAGAKRAGLH